MKSISVILMMCFMLNQVLSQRQNQDVIGLLKPWTQSLNTSGQNMGLQFLQLLQTSFDRMNQLGDQIQSSIGTQMEQMENQIHNLAKELRLTLMNHNLSANITKTKN